MSSLSIGHIVVVRFGIGIFDDRWLEYRLRLFEATALPSVASQRVAYKLVVQIDRQLPAKYKEVLKSLLGRVPNYVIRELELHADRGADLGRFVREFVKEKKVSHIITTRIDDDDAFTTHSFWATQKISENIIEKGYDAGFIAIRRGYRYIPSEKIALPAVDNNCMGIVLSMVNRAESKDTIYSCGHKGIADFAAREGYPLVFIEKNIAQWLYVNHKYSDTIFEERLSKMKSDANHVAADEVLMSDIFPIDLDAFKLWLATEKAANPLPDNRQRATEKVGQIEKEIKALRKKLKENPTDAESLGQELARLHRERFESGSRIVSVK